MIFTALLIYAVLTMWVPGRWAWSVFQIALFALAAWRVLAAQRWPLPFAALPLAIAASWPLAQLALGTTVSRSATIDAALNWFTFLVIFFVGCEILREPAAREQFLDTITMFGAVLALVAVLQQHSSHGKVFWLFPSGFAGDILGPFVNRNQYAAWIELLLPIAMLRKRRAFGLIAAAVMYGSVVASSSRAGFAIVTLEAVVVLALTATRRTTLRFVTMTAVATTVVGWSGLQQRFTSGNSETLRVEAARASLAMIRNRPWTGYGLGTWPIVYPRYASFDPGVFMNQAHNDWLQWAAEGGLPFALLLAIFTAALWKRAVPSIYGIGTVALLLHALVDYPMQQRPALAAWFVAVAAAAAAYTQPATKTDTRFAWRPRVLPRSARRSGPRADSLRTGGEP